MSKIKNPLTIITGGGSIEDIDVYIVDYFTDTVTLTKGCILPSERAIYT